MNAPIELPPLPASSLWMTDESRYRLKAGGNSKGAVPVHGKKSVTASLPLFTESQIREYALAALANSRPFAVAPELLAALKAVIRDDAENRTAEEGLSVEVCAQAIAAIAKATAP